MSRSKAESAFSWGRTYTSAVVGSGVDVVVSLLSSGDLGVGSILLGVQVATGGHGNGKAGQEGKSGDREPHFD